MALSAALVEQQQSPSHDLLYRGLSRLTPPQLCARLRALGVDAALASRVCLTEGVDGNLFLKLRYDDMVDGLGLAPSLATL